MAGKHTLDVTQTERCVALSARKATLETELRTRRMALEATPLSALEARYLAAKKAFEDERARVKTLEHTCNSLGLELQQLEKETRAITSKAGEFALSLFIQGSWATFSEQHSYSEVIPAGERHFFFLLSTCRFTAKDLHAASLSDILLAHLSDEIGLDFMKKVLKFRDLMRKYRNATISIHLSDVPSADSRLAGHSAFPYDDYHTQYFPILTNEVTELQMSHAIDVNALTAELIAKHPSWFDVHCLLTETEREKLLGTLRENAHKAAQEETRVSPALSHLRRSPQGFQLFPPALFLAEAPHQAMLTTLLACLEKATSPKDVHEVLGFADLSHAFKPQGSDAFGLFGEMSPHKKTLRSAAEERLGTFTPSA